jgi:hypothetical protein
MSTNNITIEGLTTKQKIFMDTLWSMQDMRNVTAFVRSLPKRDAQDCQSLMAIAVQLTLEQDGAMDDYKELAAAAVSRARYCL